MVWLVTGAKGQLGQALSAQLAFVGLEFVALDSKQLNITDKDQVNEVISKVRPRVIVNAAAWTDVNGAESNRIATFEVNEKGVMNLVLASRNANSTFVQISSDYVFSGGSEHPRLEDSLINPVGTYGMSKAAGELIVSHLYPEHSYIVRTAWLYSPTGKNFARTMCNLAVNSSDVVQIVDDQVGQPTHARDLASQIISLVLTKSEFGIYHGTNSGQASWFDFAKEIFRLSGADVNRVTRISSALYPSLVERPSNSVLSHNSWSKVGLSPMQDWKVSLASAMPAILDSIKREEH